MNMKWYWGKITLTAVAIFAVGYSIMNVAKATKRQVVNVVEGTGDVTIPLALVPFNFDGAKLGTFRRLVIHRSGPDQVSGVDVTVRLSDPGQVAQLAGCHLTVEDPTRINEHSSFRCVSMDSTLEGFGTMLIQTKDSDGDWVEAATVPLAIPVAVAKRIRHTAPEAAALDAERDRFREIGDSLGVLGAAMGRAGSDDEREAIETQMEDLRDQMEELKELVRDAARAKARPSHRRPPDPAVAPPPPTG